MFPHSAFASRLLSAVAKAGFQTSATSFAREVNARGHADLITSHGVRKWFMGEAMPTQARLKLIAETLGVNAAWLRFGEGDPGAGEPTELLTPAVSIMMSDYMRLTDEGKNLVRKTVALLIEAEACQQRL